MGHTRGSGRPNQLLRNLNAKIASIPMILTAVVIFLGGTIWTVVYSFTNSKLLPRLSFVGLDQYERLWAAPRWLMSVQNLAIYGLFSLIFSLVIGFVLAALMDQKIRFENAFRTIILYPFALSFIVTGLVWQWMLNPEFGVQSVVRVARLDELHLRSALQSKHRHLRHPDRRRSGRGPGLVMCLMLAGLRGIDEEIWKASRVDGIPMWKTYLFIIIPMMRAVFITTLVIIASGIVRVYDLVVAQTSGGPGIASEVPAKYVYDYMFQAQNLGQGFAASTMMLITVAIIIVPWAYLEFGGAQAWLTSIAATHRRRLPDGDLATGSRARGAESRAGCFSRRNIMIYGALICRGALLPAAALRHDRDLAEGHAGNPARQHLRAAARDHLRALGQGLVQRLHRPQLRRPVARLLELGADHHSLDDRLDRDRLGQRLRAGELALQGRRPVLHDPDRRRLHPLPGDDLSDRHRAARTGHLRLADRPDHRPHHLRHADPDAAVPQLLRVAAGGTVQGGARRRRRVLARSISEIMLPMSLPIFVVAMILQVTGIWNDFLFGVVFTRPEYYPMTVQLNNIVNSVQGVKEYNVNMAATILTGAVPLIVYFVSGRLFVRGIAAGAVKG